MASPFPSRLCQLVPRRDMLLRFGRAVCRIGDSAKGKSREQPSPLGNGLASGSGRIVRRPCRSAAWTGANEKEQGRMLQRALTCPQLLCILGGFSLGSTAFIQMQASDDQHRGPEGKGSDLLLYLGAIAQRSRPRGRLSSPLRVRQCSLLTSSVAARGPWPPAGLPSDRGTARGWAQDRDREVCDGSLGGEYRRERSP